MIHKHAGQLLSDGLCQHRSQHRGIHAAGQGAQHLAVANALPQSLDIVLHEGVHLPVAGAATELYTKLRSIFLPSAVWSTSGWN